MPAAHDWTRPGRSALVTNPDTRPAATPPTATADRNSPSVSGAPPKRASFTTGKSAIGIASKVAKRSVPNAPRTTGVRVMWRTPSTMDRIPGRCSSAPLGGSDGSRRTAYRETRKATASTA